MDPFVRSEYCYSPNHKGALSLTTYVHPASGVRQRARLRQCKQRQADPSRGQDVAHPQDHAAPKGHPARRVSRPTHLGKARLIAGRRYPDGRRRAAIRVSSVWRLAALPSG